MLQKTPLHLLDISIRNYQAIKEASITNLPADTKWIFLTGENGFGKTSVLRAIALGLCGFESYNPKKDKMPSIEVKVLADTEERTIQLAYIPQSTPTLPNVIGYGASRLNAVGEEGNSKASNPIGYLFESISYLKNIELQLSRWFFKAGEQEFKEKYQYTIETLKTLLAENITDIKVHEKTDVVYYKERYADESEEYLTFDQLASGYKGLINLAGDMILRLFEQQPEVHNPAELVGIVIIDELDLHLHPKLQRVLPTLLSRCFPKIQFIVSTHSPIPILGAPKESVFLKVTRSKEEGINIVNLDNIAVRNLTPNTILTSPFFDFDDIIAESNASLQELRTEDSYSEVIFNQILEKKLEALGKSGKSKFNQIFSADANEKN